MEAKENRLATRKDERLRQIGAKVDCRIDGFKRHARMGAVNLWEAGRLLNEAKALAGHGRWLPWLQERGIETRQAQYMMRAARELSREEVELAGSIRGAWSARRQGQIRNVSYLPEADGEDVADDAVPYRDAEWRERFRAYLAESGGKVALAWDDGAFAQWWLEGAGVRAMTDEEFVAAAMRTFSWGTEDVGPDGISDAGARRFEAWLDVADS